MNTKTAYQKLETIFTKVAHLSQLQTISKWDEAVMMPPGGGEARAQMLATLSGIIHKKISSKHIGELIAQAKTETLNSHWQQKNLYWMEKTVIDATCLPLSLIERKTLATLRSEQAWRTLRAENNWQDFLPLLQETFSLVREAAHHQAQFYNKAPYDVLLDHYSPGITQQLINPIFTHLKNFLPEFLKTVTERQSQKNTIPINGEFPIDKQYEFCRKIVTALGFDFNYGRLDVSHHPFCCGVPGDVRITTRYDNHSFLNSLMGVCHETGHALYEKGLPAAWINQPVGQAFGMAVHESQSLIFEMQACRSSEFIRFLTPHVIEHFGEQAAFTPENLLRTYTRVQPGLIRVDADEVSYPLHIILRYEIERDLMADKIAIKDLPEIWNNAMQKFLGLNTQGDFRNGVMQDVHWPSGAFGYFPSYTLGAITAAQLFHKAKADHADLLPRLAQGDFSLLAKWLQPRIHQQASLLTYDELMTSATGETLNPNYFIEHLQQRYTPHT